MHRVDLHTELKRLAQQYATIHLSSEIIHANCESGEIGLADGTTVIKDLIIAADGIHVSFPRAALSFVQWLMEWQSVIAKEVQGNIATASETGQSAFRFLIPSNILEGLGREKDLFKTNPAGITIATDPQRRLVWYPCRG